MSLSRMSIVGILLCIISIQLYAQKLTYTLEEAITAALKNNRDVIISEMNVRKSEAAVDEAFGYALPSLDITANLAHMIEKPKTAFPDFEALLTNATYNILFDENVLPRDDDKFKSMATKLQSFAQTNSFETKAQVTQILFNSAVFRGIGASQIYLDLAKVQYEAAKTNTILNVKKAFYGVLLSKELLNIIKCSLINAEENLKNINALYEQGLTSDFDALQAEVQVENIRPSVRELENTYLNALNGLKILLSVNLSDSIEVIGSFEYKDEELPLIEDASLLALKNNLDINSLRIKKNVDEEFINIERADYWPTIAAFGNYSYAGSSDDWNFQTYNSSMVGVTFSLNLFKGGRAANRIEQANIATMQTQEQISLTEDFITSQVTVKILDLKKVKSQIKALNRNVELAQKAYNISTTRYKEGTGTQLEIKNADVELRSAKTNLIKSVHDYIIAEAELDQLLGRVDSKYKNEITEE
ncbi:MAG: TolC family protein [Bacteroidetes bacterium]|nr:TolC family protein [Bacteroidota bacterium]